MPLNVKRFCCSVLLVFTVSILLQAQTSGDVMRDRVSKAKAFIAVKNYNAAIYELENIRRETNETTVNGVVNVLLINSFLEQGDYKRAQDFLTELSKSNKPGAAAIYFAAAGQVVKGARNQMERYRSLGLNVADPNLPKDAVADVDKMRETLEKVVEQTKVLSKDKTQTSNAMALMEEATNARGGLARDNFDANRWKNEVADAREDLASSRSVVLSAINETPVPSPQSSPNGTVAQSIIPPSTNPAKTTDQPIVMQPVPISNGKTNAPKIEPTEKQPLTETLKEESKTQSETPKTAENTNASSNQSRNRVAENSNQQTVSPTQKESPTEPQIIQVKNEIKNNSPLEVGSLVAYATEKADPVYPAIARNMRLSGVVKVELVIDETGQVVQIQNPSGPPMLQRAAMDAIKRWKFKPFTRDGQATKATGFVSFNFRL